MQKEVEYKLRVVNRYVVTEYTETKVPLGSEDGEVAVESSSRVIYEGNDAAKANEFYRLMLKLQQLNINLNGEVEFVLVKESGGEVDTKVYYAHDLEDARRQQEKLLAQDGEHYRLSFRFK